MNIATPFACATAGLPRVSDAIALVSARFAPVAEMARIPLAKACGRILAEDAVARATVPPCDRSAMDGYAFRHGDAGLLRLAGRALAGKPFPRPVGEGECVAIATGAAIPDGCDTVAMREHCRETPDGIFVEASAGANIRRCGEDFRAGACLAASGTRLDPRHIALLASGGIADMAVRRRLRIAVLSIGDELHADAPDGVFDANRAMLVAMCESLGAEVDDLGIFPDDRAAIADMLATAAASHDAIVGSAGTSVGDEDHARGALLDCGGEVLIAGVAIKPGKPVAFGRIGRCLHIALPGNPAAAYITFAALGLPMLRHLSGAGFAVAPEQDIRAAFAHRKKKGLREYLRVTLRHGADGTLEAVRSAKDGSAMLSSLAASDGLVCLDEEVGEIEPGVRVSYRAFATLTAP